MTSRMRLDDHTRRLPFEILGKIFLYLGETQKGRIGELKKCRLVSPRWYKVVQDLFRDDFSQKLLTHYDGKNQTFGSSRTFGQNLFGSYYLNFPLLKISNSEYYLTKRWLRNVTIENNVQYLELKDNLLDLWGFLETFLAFQNVKTIKIVQTSKDLNLMEKVRQLYQLDESIFGRKPSIDLFRKSITRSRSKGEEEDNIFMMDMRKMLLKNLKSVKFEIVHPSVLNYFSFFLGDFTDCELEHLSVKFDLYGLLKSAEKDIKRIEPKEMRIWAFEYLKNMSKSLKSLELIVGTNIENYDSIPQSYSTHSVICKVYRGISSSILDSFEYGKNFRKIEHLVIDIPLIIFSINYDTLHFEKFIKKQRNLKNSYFSFYHGRTFQRHRMELAQETFKQFINNNSSTFGFHISGVWPNFLAQLTENLSVLHIRIERHSTWRFSHEQVSIFPNCKELEITFYGSSAVFWHDFQIPEIFRKFPNLETLKIRGIKVGSDGRRRFILSPEIGHNEFQFIIQNYTNLKHLYLINCFRGWSIQDSSFTGLPIEAHIHHLNNPDLIVKPEELEGVPISNLKKLEVLVMKKASGSFGRVTDISALFGFQEMPHLKYLEIQGAQITNEGYSIIQEKSGSEKIERPNLGEKEWSMYTRNPVITQSPGKWATYLDFILYY